MPIGHDGRTQARRRVLARAAARRRVCRARLIALLLVLLPSALLLASTVSASASGESSLAERQARAASKAAEHEAQHAANVVAKAEEREAALRARKVREETNHPNGSVVFSCTQVTWTFKAFPDMEGNAVSQQVGRRRSRRRRSTATPGATRWTCGRSGTPTA
jgi:hypothetical protein